jgi:alanine dehydrogenase
MDSSCVNGEIMNLINLPILSSEDVIKALPMHKAIEVLRSAFRIISNGDAVIPERLHLDLPKTRGGSLTMPVYLPKLDLVCIKFLSIFSDNPIKYNLPAIQAVVLLMDAKNGKMLVMMSGGALTAIRTGAASGVATDLLARRDAEVVAIFGAGVQGKTQLEAICNVRKIRKAYIFELDRKLAEDFVVEMTEKLGIEIRIPKHESDLKKADIISTATSAVKPVLKHQNLKQGVHINAVGAYQPNTREIPEETIINSRLFVDKISSCLEEAGDLLIPIKEGIITKDHILGEIGELVQGKKVGRRDDNEITLFKSVGNAVQDLVAAAEVYKRVQ